MRRMILLVDGSFLLGVGSVQMALEIAGHFWQVGPYAASFGGSSYTIGFVEAHGLAALIGFLLLRAAMGEQTSLWHGFAVAVHLLLGGANLLFWDSFVTFGLVDAGRAATLLHLLFVTVQSICYVSSNIQPLSQKTEV